MRHFLEKISLLQALVGMIVFSLIAPLPILMGTYILNTYSSKQEAIHEINAKKFNLYSEVFSDSLWNYYPELGQKLLNQLTLEPNLISINVTDSEGKRFVSWESNASYPSSEVVTFEKILEKDGRIIGFFEMHFHKMGIIESVLKDMTLFGSILALQAIFLIIVISFVYTHKVIRPIRRLVDDATQLAEHKLDKPFLWNDHDEIGVLGVALDKTRIKLKELFEKLKGENERLDEKVKQRTNELENASRYKSEFLANMSHEIRTPMNAIVGMSHLISKTALNPTQANYIHKIKDASSILLHIINDILDFSKIEAGKMEVESVAFDLHKELKKSCSIFSVLAKEKGLGFESSFVHTNRFFRGDSHKIMQIVNNFLSNAIKFTTQGIIFFNLHEEKAQNETMRLIFSVRDTGMGISKERQGLLFQAFGQLDTSITRKHGGTGLGLYICTQLASMMEGVIRVQSEEGRGSTFSLEISLPLAQAMELQKEENTNQFNPLHILLITDDKTLKNTLFEFIRSFGFFITCKQSQDVFIEEFEDVQESPYQLLLIDQHLTKTSGMKLFETLKARVGEERVPSAILMSQEDDIELKKEALNAGFRTVLTKPINPSMLYDDITSFCEVMTQQPLFDPSRIDLSEKKILIVEDNEVNLEVVVYLLKETQAKIEVARNGLEAVAFAQDRAFDLILMDLQMPLMDGYEATRIIRNELQLPTPIVAMTANVMAHDIEKCLSSGMNFHIGKPFEIEDFYGTLLEALHLGLSDARPRGHMKKAQKRERFDKDGAIKKLGGAEILWNKTLCSFYEQYHNAPTTLAHLIHADNLTTLIDYVHTIKGLCGTVGAYILSDEAAHLESFLKAHKSVEGVDIKAFNAEHEVLFASIKSIYEALQESVSASSLFIDEASLNQINETLDLLHNAIETSHISRMNALLDDLSALTKIREYEKFSSIVLACKMFDFDGALMHVQTLKKELNHG